MLRFMFATVLSLTMTALAEDRGTPPGPEIAAVEKAWKVQGLAKRMKDVGATGQADAYWELVNLLETQPAARTDKNIEKILSWLLFDAVLLNQHEISESASAKLSKLLPGVGKKLLLQRLKPEVANINSNLNGPWQWEDFQAIDRDVLASAYEELRASTPANNPLVKLWFAAGSIACERANADKEFAEARAALERSLAARSKQIIQHLVESAAGSGVRAMLPNLLTQACDDFDKAQPGGVPEACERLHYLLGLPLKSNATKTSLKSDLERLKGWLPQNLSKLAWDSTKRVYIGASPPGMEELFEYAQKVDAAFNKKYSAQLPIRSVEALNALVWEVAALLKDNPKDLTAVDAATNFLIALIDSPLEIGAQRQMYIMGVAKDCPGAIVKYWAKKFGPLLAVEEPMPLYGLDREIDDPGVKALALDSFEPRFAREYIDVRKQQNPKTSLIAALRWMVSGGKPNIVDVAAFISRVPESTAPGNNLIWRWYQLMECAGRTGVLRLLLAQAASYPDKSIQAGECRQLQTFRSFCRWRDNAGQKTLAEALPELIDWFERNESALKFNREKNCFEGALPPNRTELYAAVQKLPAGLSINPDDVLAPETLRRKFGAISKRVSVDPTFAADPNLGVVLALLLDRDKAPADLRDPILRMTSKLSEENALKVCVAWLKDMLSHTALEQVREFSDELRHSNFSIETLDKARAELLPAQKRNYEANKQSPMAALALVFCAKVFEKTLLDQIVANKTQGDRLILFKWADLFSHSGNTAGLRLVQLLAKQDEDDTYSAVIYIDGWFGMRSRGNNYNDASVAKRLAFYKDFIDANETKLKWSAAENKFILPEGIAPPPPPDGANKSATPPRPPREGF